MLTSAFDGTGIKELFQSAAKQYIDKIISGEIDSNKRKTVNINQKKEGNEKKGCCD